MTKVVTETHDFIVRHPDGRVGYYKKLLEGYYALTLLEDALGFQIKYQYNIESNTVYLISIDYGGKNNEFPYHVVFKLKDRKSPIKKWRGGKSYVDKFIYNEIIVKSDTSGVYRTYVIKHTQTPLDSERIENIIIKNGGGESLKPLEFNYKPYEGTTVAKTINSNLGFTEDTRSLGHLAVGDFEGIGEMSSVYILSNKQLKPDHSSPYTEETIVNEYTLRHSKLGDLKIPDVFFSTYATDNASSGDREYRESTSSSVKEPIDLAAGKVLVKEETGKKLPDVDLLISLLASIGRRSGEGISFPETSNTYSKTRLLINLKNIKTRKDYEYFANIAEPKIPACSGNGSSLSSRRYYNSSGKKVNKYERKFIYSDFNGDGSIDILVLHSSHKCGDNLLGFTPAAFLDLALANDNGEVPVRYLNRGNKSDFLFNYEPEEDLEKIKSEFYTIEFDGDGTPELVHLERDKKRVKIYKFDFKLFTLKLVYSTTLDNFDQKTPLVFGDYNGDGLTDFITPKKVYDISENSIQETVNSISNDTHLWNQYLSTGKKIIKNIQDFTAQKLSFCVPAQRNVIVETGSFWDKFWSGPGYEVDHTEYASCSVIPIDYNHDGRTDLVSFKKFGKIKYEELLKNSTVENYTYNNISSSLDGLRFITNVYNKDKEFSFKSTQSGNNLLSLSSTKISPLSTILTSQMNTGLTSTRSFFMIHDPLMKKDYKFSIDYGDLMSSYIHGVDNNSGVVQTIEYAPMDIGSNDNVVDDVYSVNRSDATYQNLSKDYYIHSRVPNKHLVKRINTLLPQNKTLTKEYRYENAIQQLSGLGFLGFMKTFASDLYESKLENNKYVRVDKQRQLYWNINTYDPLLENRMVISTYGLCDGESLKTTELKYENLSNGLVKGQKYYITKQEKIHDFQKEITITKNHTYYPDSRLLEKTVTNYNNEGTSETEIVYQSNWILGNHRFKGKIKESLQTSNVTGDIFTTKDQFIYNQNGLTTQTKKYGHNTKPIVTSFIYDDYGNVISETVSTEGLASQTTRFKYDETHRFVISTTSPEGLESKIDEMNEYGWVKKETSALGLTTSYKHDGWGNVIETTDYLNNVTTQKKQYWHYAGKGYYWVSNVKEGTPETITYFDPLDRPVRIKTKSLNNKWVLTETAYDVYGNIIKKSEPYFEGETASLWNETIYDELDRPITKKDYTGKTTSICYNGLNVTVDDGYQKYTRKLNALGQTVYHKDQGGEITYQYYANGALKRSNYDGIVIKIEQDGWGNKTKMEDPSAGTYLYEYDAFGRMTKEMTPKGENYYIYDDYGKLLYESSTGDRTNISQSYQYDPETHLLTSISGYSGNLPFTYETKYDSYFRIKGKKEIHPTFTYETNTIFDDFGRVDKETVSSSMRNSGYTLSTTIQNKYDTNGILYQKIDTDTQKGIWTIQNVNARGQSLESKYGNGYKLKQSFSYYTPKTILHQLDTSNHKIVDLEYKFDIKKGVLQQRSVNGFNSKEDFIHDALNRLTKEVTNGATTNQYTYDNQGRMTYNSSIGKYQYPSNNYHIDQLNLNSKGNNLKEDRGFHRITFNSYKKASEIYLEGHDRISYDYSILKNRAVAYYGSEDTDKLKRPIRKYYSADHAIEITHHIIDKRIKMVQYIDGDPYSASYVKTVIMDGSGSSTSTLEKNYFLHRDYQGSIIAISDQNGGIVEQRYYDAWGNLKEYKSTLFTEDNMLIDRGYTGHEHLANIGLIHMNGRLYDPEIRRFLGPDNFIQDPYNTQNFNRYSYVLNNPLVYTDPSGESLVGAIIIGAIVGVTSNAIINMSNDNPWWYGAGKSGAIGGATAALSFGIGEAVSHWAVQAYMHAMVGGSMSTIEGGEFMSGFASGAFSSLLSSGIQELGKSGFQIGEAIDTGRSSITPTSTFASRNRDLFNAITIASGGLSGGVGSVIAGGDFWKGIRQGIITSGLNHVGNHISQQLRRSLPSYDDLDRNYPRYDKGEVDPNAYSSRELYEMLGGNLELNYDANPSDFQNTCAVRISHVLNKAGHLIPFESSQTISSSSRPKRWYYYRTIKLKKYIERTYKKADVYKGNFMDNYFSVFGRKGIIFFDINWSDASGHFTLFNGTNTVGGNYNTLDYFNWANKVYFWELK